MASGKHALGICDICGFTCKLLELRKLFRDRRLTALKVCADCWNVDHPQNTLLGAIHDDESLRDPRPDNRAPGLTNITYGWRPVFSLQAAGQIGVVTVVL